MGKRVLATNLKEAIAWLRDPQVTSLDCAYARLGDGGIAALAQHLPASAITELVLEYNQISDAGLAALAPYLPATAITLLHLDLNQISDAGLETLAQHLPASAITSLSLGDNKIGDAQRMQAEQLCAATKTKAEEVVVAWQEGAHGFAPQDWQDATRLLPAMAQHLEEAQQYTPEQIQHTLRAMADQAHADGLSTRDFILKALPLGDAMQWLEDHGQPLSASELLNPDGSFPQDRFVCQKGLYALCEHPNLWESRAQAEKAIRSVPEGMQAALPTHQLLTTLGQRDAAKQQGRA